MGLELKGTTRSTRKRRGTGKDAYILIGNDFDTLNVAGCLENLTQNLLSDPLVKTSDIESSLVRLRSCTTSKASTARGQSLSRPGHGRGYGSRNGVRVLGDMERRGRHVGGVRLVALSVFIPGGAALGRWGKLRSVGVGTRVSHGECIRVTLGVEGKRRETRLEDVIRRRWPFRTAQSRETRDSKAGNDRSIGDCPGN